MPLALCQTGPCFNGSAVQAFCKYWGKKGEIARNEQFLLFPKCFLLFWGAYCHVHHLKICHLQTL